MLSMYFITSLSERSLDYRAIKNMSPATWQNSRILVSSTIEQSRTFVDRSTHLPKIQLGPWLKIDCLGLNFANHIASNDHLLNLGVLPPATPLEIDFSIHDARPPHSPTRDRSSSVIDSPSARSRACHIWISLPTHRVGKRRVVLARLAPLYRLQRRISSRTPFISNLSGVGS